MAARSGVMPGGQEGPSSACLFTPTLLRVETIFREQRVLKVFVRVGLTSIAVQGERFPLGRKRGVGDKVGEGVTASGLVGREQVGGMG